MKLEEKIAFLQDIMDVEEGVLTEDTILADVEEWDSLATLSLLAEMRKRFGIQLTTAEIKKFETVSDILQIIPD
ncbi:MAG: acyl carrier protein [Eubacterium sp.]|nr:acyl carrier protein [Eubacterium sp.]